MAFGIWSITAGQLARASLALPAFVPVMVAPGYLAAWSTNLHGFRQRSLVGRLMWSTPLSLAISTILADLAGHFFSITAAAALFIGATVLCLAVLLNEALQLRRTGRRWNVGWQPGGTIAILLAIAWAALTLFLLVDIQYRGQLFPSVVVWDMGSRVNWVQAVLRTGVPPANSLYWFHHASVMRQYYFWYVLCAVVARLSWLPARAVFIAGCVWGGFSVVALFGLYLREFLGAGARLRRQFLIAVALLTVTGLDLLPVALLCRQGVVPLDFEWWSPTPIQGWIDCLLWVPHHIAALVCCLFAFLLAWIDGCESTPRSAVRALFCACAIASAAGLSVYVAFGFFLLMVAWGIWQLVAGYGARRVSMLAIGGGMALILLLPYLRELTSGQSYVRGGSVFAPTVRRMIRPEILRSMAGPRASARVYAMAATDAGNLILLIPGYILELGFYFIVLVVLLVPAWRGRSPLSAPQRTLLFLCIAALPMLSFLRSSVLDVNDFGVRAALLLQFPLLLLGTQLVDAWTCGDAPSQYSAHPLSSPPWLRRLAFVTLTIGLLGTAGQLCVLRFGVPILEAAERRMHDPLADRISRTAQISLDGYAQLDRVIPQNSIVQFNPDVTDVFLMVTDQIDVDHQIAIAADRNGCGSALGGDPNGCPAMASALDAVFGGADAEKARSVCRELGIHYLIARVYDPAWKDSSGWVWTLPPVVAQDQFRALDCQR